MLPASGKIETKISPSPTNRWSQLFDKETDWNVISEKKPAVNDRQVKLSRGKFLGGCSGCNGTLCIRGSKQDYDDWGVEGWSGEEFFKYIRKVRLFTTKETNLPRRASVAAFRKPRADWSCNHHRQRTSTESLGSRPPTTMAPTAI